MKIVCEVKVRYTDKRPKDKRPTDKRPTDKRPTDKRPTDKRPTRTNLRQTFVRHDKRPTKHLYKRTSDTFVKECY